MIISKELIAAVKHLSSLRLQAEVGIVLGTGLGEALTSHIKKPTVVPYNSIPYFPVSTVSGHKGQFVFGELGGKQVVAMQGRVHFYEGYPMQKVTFPVQVMREFGISTLLVSNAAGNLNPKWKKGDLMLLEDHINLMPDSPLHGLGQQEKSNLFLDQSCPYHRVLNKKLKSIAKAKQIKLHEGVYVANTGPALETKAEYKFLRMIGGDAVGMSTVPEIIMANHFGIRCAAVSVLTNDATDAGAEPVELEDVIKVAAKASKKLTELFVTLISKL